MDLKLSIFLCLLFAVLIKADDLQCTGCLCATADNSNAFARGDPAILCIHFITVDSTGSIVTQRAAYPIVVDTFSSVQLKGGQQTFKSFDYVSIVAQAHGTMTSPPLTYIQTSQAFYASAFSAVIQISSGVIQSVLWDHRCATCDSSDCFKFSMTNGTLIDTICKNSTCASGSDSDCDPQVYVTWVGSDKNGNKINSAGMRLSRFREFSTSDLLSSQTISPFVMPTPPSNATNSTNSTTPDSSGSHTTNGTNTGNQGTTPDQTHPTEPTDGNGATNEGGDGASNGSTGENTHPDTTPTTPVTEPTNGNGATNEGGDTHPDTTPAPPVTEPTGDQNGSSTGGDHTSGDQTEPSPPADGHTSTPTGEEGAHPLEAVPKL